MDLGPFWDTVIGGAIFFIGVKIFEEIRIRNAYGYNWRTGEWEDKNDTHSNIPMA